MAKTARQAIAESVANDVKLLTSPENRHKPARILAMELGMSLSKIYRLTRRGHHPFRREAILERLRQAPASREDLMAEMGISRANAYHILNKLEHEGVLEQKTIWIVREK